jgi:triacylglycerol lipase
MRQHVFMTPGMFGFGRLGSFNYFAHVQRELIARFAAAGHELFAHTVDDLPTASIRRRATNLAEVVRRESADEPIHLLGHSTGGLDARLVASPATVGIPAELLAWLPRLRSVTTMNTPHFGTPLASFFTTASGQRALAALSVLTVTGLTLGAQPLAAAGVILGFLHTGEQRLPIRVQLLDRSVTSIVGLVDDARGPEVREFLKSIEEDQGSLLQLSPESMDLVVAGFADRPGVHYQSTVSMAPAPKPRRFIETVGHPWRSISLSLFYALHHITGRVTERYPCAAMGPGGPWSGDANEALLVHAFGRSPRLDDNDGVVPLRSQLWANVAWAGLGDHLDVLGHYDGDPTQMPADERHRDWLSSGSRFSAASFTALMDAVATGMLE